MVIITYRGSLLVTKLNYEQLLSFFTKFEYLFFLVIPDFHEIQSGWKSTHINRVGRAVYIAVVQNLSLQVGDRNTECFRTGNLGKYILLHRVRTVSYTHLDVYKRQAQLRKNCPPGALDCRAKQRQALLHWAIDSRKI